jgi:hypothetical protein
MITSSCLVKPYKTPKLSLPTFREKGSFSWGSILAGILHDPSHTKTRISFPFMTPIMFFYALGLHDVRVRHAFFD